MHLSTPHDRFFSGEEPESCGAKTRAGTPCPTPPVQGRTRCRMHGGATPRGLAHPSYKHGRYSYALIGGKAFGIKLEREQRRQERAARKRSKEKLEAFFKAWDAGNVAAAARTELAKNAGLDRGTLRTLLDAQGSTRSA